MVKKTHLGELEAEFLLKASGFANVQVQRSLQLPIRADDDACEAALFAELDRQYGAIRQLAALVCRVIHWREGANSGCALLAGQGISVKIDVQVDGAALLVKFLAEYKAAHLAPLLHSVKIPLGDELPVLDDVVRRLEREWSTVQRILTIGQTGSISETRRIPPPFLEAEATPVPDQLMARAATPQEAKKFTERYLDNFRFPIEVIEEGRQFGFIPRVDLSPRRDSLRLIVTLLGQPEGDKATFVMGGSKEVAIPLSEIYVQGEQLNRKTKEGLLELIKGLCRALGRERGLTGDVDISRPR